MRFQINQVHQYPNIVLIIELVDSIISPIYTNVSGLSENRSCKIFIAGTPQHVTRYLMRTTTHIQRGGGQVSMLHTETKLISEILSDLQGFILRKFTQYRFHATTARLL